MLTALVGAPASAATVQPDTAQPWTRPATNPCRGLCGERWALDRMRNVMPAAVYDELAERIEAGDAQTDYLVGTGDDIRAMSYAKAGVPYVDFSRRIAHFPQGIEYPARGHFVMQNGVLYRFVRIDACGNWALIVEQDVAAVPAVLSWLFPDRLILLSGLDDDIIIGGAGNDTLGPATEDLPVGVGGRAMSGRRVGYLYFPASGNGPVARFSPFLAGGFGSHAVGWRSGGGHWSGFGRTLADVTFPSGVTTWTPFTAPFTGPGTNAGRTGDKSLPPTGNDPLPPTGENPPPGPNPFAPPAPPDDRTAGETLPMPIPLPGTLVLVAVWLGALGAIRLRRA